MKEEVETVYKDFSYCSDLDSLSIYLMDINKIPLLKREEEIRLGREAKAGSKEAKDELVKANLRFVVNIARRYQNRGLSLEDLISEGNIGLIHAAERFDVDRGHRFISYAIWWIKQSILKAIGEKSTLIRLPLNRAQELLKIEQTAKEIEKNKGDAVELDELADDSDLNKERTATFISVLRNVSSLDTPLSSEESADTLSNIIEDNTQVDPEKIVIKQALQEEIERVLSTLSSREHDVIKHRFGLAGLKSHSLKEIGDKYNLTKERIRQIESKALRRLRVTGRGKTLLDYINN